MRDGIAKHLTRPSLFVASSVNCKPCTERGLLLICMLQVIDPVSAILLFFPMRILDRDCVQVPSATLTAIDDQQSDTHKRLAIETASCSRETTKCNTNSVRLTHVGFSKEPWRSRSGLNSRTLDSQAVRCIPEAPARGRDDWLRGPNWPDTHVHLYSEP